MAPAASVRIVHQQRNAALVRFDTDTVSVRGEDSGVQGREPPPQGLLTSTKLRNKFMVRQDRVHQDFDLNASWEECAPGTIGDLQNRLNDDRRRKSIVRIGAPIVVMALLGMGIWNFGGSASSPAHVSPAHQEQLPEFNFGGVTCSELQASMQQFAMGELKPAQQQAFAIHLQQCPVCQEKMNAMNEIDMPMADKNNLDNSANGFQTHRTLLASTVDWDKT